MRRIVGIVAAVIMLSSLPGCAVVEEISAPAEPELLFSSRAQISAPGTEIGCVFSRYEGGLANITILSPAEIQGMSYDWTGDHFLISFSGLSVKSEKCMLPDTSFAVVMVDALHAAEKELSETGEGEYTGNLGGKAFSITTDPETGRILSLHVPYCGISAEFFDDI